jgi:hypothetical protein
LPVIAASDALSNHLMEFAEKAFLVRSFPIFTQQPSAARWLASFVSFVPIAFTMQAIEAGSGDPAASRRSRLIYDDGRVKSLFPNSTMKME